MSITDLYQQLQQHANRQSHRGTLPSANLQLRADNPMCGDELEITINHTGEQIEAIRFDGHACAVCLASASIMAAYLEGARWQQATNGYHQLANQLNNRLSAIGDNPLNTAFTPLLGIAAYPARIQCALLPWRAVVDAAPETN